MNRRAFLQTLAAGLAGAALDPERLTWKPGAKTHILPPAQGWTRTASGLHVFTRGDIITIEGEYAVNPATGRVTKRLKQFVVTADVRSDGSLATIPIAPAIIERGPHQNVGASVDRAARVRPYAVGCIGDGEWFNSQHG